MLYHGSLFGHTVEFIAAGETALSVCEAQAVVSFRRDEAHAIFERDGGGAFIERDGALLSFIELLEFRETLDWKQRRSVLVAHTLEPFNGGAFRSAMVRAVRSLL